MRQVNLPLGPNGRKLCCFNWVAGRLARPVKQAVQGRSVKPVRMGL